MHSMTYMGPWVWSFVVIIVALIAFVGAMLYVGADKFSKPSTDRLRREEAQRLGALERQKGEPVHELV